MEKTMPMLAMLALPLGCAVGCVDLRSFEGEWTGGIVAESAVRQGFTADTEVDRLELSNLSLQQITARLTTSDGKFAATRLLRIARAASDSLASLTFEGDPLRSYLLFAPVATSSTLPPVVPSPGPAVVVISFFADEHVELRVIRGNDLFGVFYLRRPEDPEL